MDSNLQELIELAREYKMTPAEQASQIRSFTYGNTHLENDDITREEVEKIVTSLIGLEMETKGANPIAVGT